MKINKVYFYFLFLFIGTSLLGCKKEPTEEPTPQIQRGDIIRSNKISALTVNGINLGLINSGSTTSLTPIYDVDMIKLEYYTIDENGAPTVASGSLFIPASAGTYPMLSYHHGTLVKRSNAPSSLGPFSSEGMAGALGASIGFVSCLPDYLGLGESKKVHPYLLSSLSASTSIDMLIAGKNYCQEQGITLTNDLFICGYSEGGFVTMATQIMLEASYGTQFNLKASAPMAGPYNVEATADGLLSVDTYSSPALIGFILYSYSKYYNDIDIKEIFNAPYDTQIPSLFDGTKDLATINSSLTTDMTALLNQIFVSDFNDNTNHSLRTHFRENSLLSWNPKSPIRLYHSMEDEIVPYSVSVNAQAILSAKSSSTVELRTVETGSHVGAATPIVLSALEWFYSLNNGS